MKFIELAWSIAIKIAIAGATVMAVGAVARLLVEAFMLGWGLLP